MLFDSLDSMLRVALAAILAYVALLVILRLAGKRSLAKLNAFDLAVTVAFGSALSTIVLTSSVPLADGIVALAVLAMLQFAVAKSSVLSDRFATLIRSEPRLLVRDGRFLDKAMTDERITRREIESAIRNSGTGSLGGVAAVVLETDGSLSVIRAGEEGELTAFGAVQGSEGDGR